MGIYDGFTNHDEKTESEIEYSDNFYIISNLLYLNKNIKIHLNMDQYTNKFKLDNNNKLDIDPNKIFINPKSLVKTDSLGNFIGSIMTYNNDNKLKVNYSSDFYENFNGSIFLNTGNGLQRSSDNKISIALGFATKFDNGKLSLDTSALVNNTSGTITLDPDKKRFELNYSTDMLKDSSGKIWLKLNNKDFIREDHNGISLNIDDSIKYDVNSNKLSSNIDKYLTTGGDIYLDSGKMKINMNNYVVDNAGTIIMDTNNKLSVNITDQTAGQIYLNNNNKLKLRLSPLYFTDSSGYFYPKINYDHAFDRQNYKLNLNIDSPLYFTTNKKLSLSNNQYFKQTNDGQLDLDLNKIQTEIVKPTGTGLQLNNNGTFSLNNSISNLSNLSPLSGLEISGGQLIVNEHTLSRNLIRLNSNSPITRDDNNLYELKIDRISVDFDFNTGNLKIKDGYVTNLINDTYIKNHINSSYIKSIIDKNYIKDNILNESWYKDNYKYIGKSILRRCAFCWINLEDLSMIVKNTDSSNVTTISKIANYRYKDKDYFECYSNPIFEFRHYTTLLFNNIVFGNYIKFNNTNQYITFTEFYTLQTINHYVFNFIFKVEKQTIDINSTLFESNNGKTYIKILYNNQGIIYKINELENEKIVNTSSSLLDKKFNLMIYCQKHLFNMLIVKVYLNGILISEIVNKNTVYTMFTETFHQSYLANNQAQTQALNGNLYDFSLLYNITENEAYNLHKYYNYIHNI